MTLPKPTTPLKQKRHERDIQQALKQLQEHST
ncbi:hypothetical protein CCACVL1_04311 [Corchorus capsularis]|uniref:Uncharacterized protein n=1 Tax=Corchorus capsularis TaxID=210143 RepID=A0A1R3JTL8_COCAP|nr:hypothetical protein CCACVL1_04311 [Corchorus capsularis]